jgi:hypothetical protein
MTFVCGEGEKKSGLNEEWISPLDDLPGIWRNAPEEGVDLQQMRLAFFGSGMNVLRDVGWALHLHPDLLDCRVPGRAWN